VCCGALLKLYFTNLLSHIKAPLLTEAYNRLRKDAAPGVDGVTWRAYGEDLDARVRDLQDRIHGGNYHPQPVRRVHIPKGDGGTRPLGIPALEDKVVQQAARMILEPIYEQEFLEFSYGFRPGRSPHRALDALAVAIGRKVNWVLDADICAFYDTIEHGWMQKFIEHTIADQRMVRLLMKWLHAGVLENGEVRAVQEGAPQGGGISPLLSNVYLHYALDLWVQQWRKRHARGEVSIVRYADDVVLGFQYEQDARAMSSAMAERLAKFGLELHPEKTRVLRFGRYARKECKRDGRERPETFDFLGFTHIAAQSRGGWFQLQRRTSRKKRVAKLSALRVVNARPLCEDSPVRRAGCLMGERPSKPKCHQPGRAAMECFAPSAVGFRLADARDPHAGGPARGHKGDRRMATRYRPRRRDGASTKGDLKGDERRVGARRSSCSENREGPERIDDRAGGPGRQAPKQASGVRCVASRLLRFLQGTEPADWQQVATGGARPPYPRATRSTGARTAAYRRYCRDAPVQVQAVRRGHDRCSSRRPAETTLQRHGDRPFTRAVRDRGP